ncbi:TetR/AcrR family transcriptional regulator [Glycocaulis profundi]|nr:TetR/AcrR family transcriptional regulator [Glycocaulis profundi]
MDDLASAKTARFHEKRERILDAATVLINRNGVKGMTFVDVAQMVDLNTTSITYYFKRRELLAAAVLERALDRIESAIRRAGELSTPRERVAALVADSFALQAGIRRREERPIAILSDMRALSEPLRGELNARYVEMVRALRGFFDAGEDEAGKARAMVRAHVLVQNLFWLPAWLDRYSTGDFERVERRLMEVFEHGIAPEGAPWAPQMLAIDESALRTGIEGMPDNFMRAATGLINERGYRGASVEQIASELNVTKGSFYHHLEAKDDLVLECFGRSYGRVSLVQRAAANAGGDHWRQLSSAVATLLDVQFFSDFPLLRTTALQALPGDVRADVMDRSNRMARRFAGMMMDGITEGTVRAVDPLIASQVLMGAINAAYDLRKWATGMKREAAIAHYGSTLARGLFDDA